MKTIEFIASGVHHGRDVYYPGDKITVPDDVARDYVETKMAAKYATVPPAPALDKESGGPSQALRRSGKPVHKPFGATRKG